MALKNQYIFDNNANDSVGGANGTPGGATSPSPEVGYFDLSSGNSSYEFSGGNDGTPGNRERIELPRTDYDYATTDDFTWALWFNTTKSDTALHIFAANQNINATGAIWMYMNGTENVGMQIIDTSGNNITLTTSGTYNDGVWHHLAGVYDASATELKVYVDGLEVLSGSNGSLTGDFYQSTFKMSLGAAWVNNSSNWARDYTGKIGRFENYNNALSATEIRNLYNQAKKTTH